jgi:prepilin-type N-terminal cleavage/methylation domain-containing protein
MRLIQQDSIMKKPPTHRRSAFTLIEVLVVVGIIAILVSILLPSLQKARTAAKNTKCLSHLKSLFVANSVYINEYDEFPALNNDDDDGAWQYNYLIYDGDDYESNHGPLS